MRLHLGSEIEFFAEHDVAQPALSEYYPDQWEVNDFHVANNTLDANLSDLFSWADDVKQRSRRGRMSFGGYVQGSGGPVFSGVHLHLQVRGRGQQRDQGVSREDKEKFAARLSQVVMADILRYYGLSFRCMTSHHLHGAHRMSSYTYKQKEKFVPVGYHPQFDTYELRCIEPDMLYTEEGKAALKSILQRAYDYLCGKDVRIHSTYSRLAQRLSELPGDLTHEQHALNYMEFASRCAEEGVQVRFSIDLTQDPRRVSVRYGDVRGQDGDITVRQITYRTNLNRGGTSIQVNHGIERRAGEHIRMYRGRIERETDRLRRRQQRTRGRSAFTIPLRHRPDGCPIEPQREPRESMGEYSARVDYYVHHRDRWFSTERRDMNNPYPHMSIEASAHQRWGRDGAGHINGQAGEVYRAWNQRRNSLRYVVFCQDGSVRYMTNMPESVPSTGRSQIHSRNTLFCEGTVEGILRDKIARQGQVRERVQLRTLQQQVSYSNTTSEWVLPSGVNMEIRSPRRMTAMEMSAQAPSAVPPSPDAAGTWELPRPERIRHALQWCIDRGLAQLDTAVSVVLMQYALHHYKLGTGMDRSEAIKFLRFIGEWESSNNTPIRTARRYGMLSVNTGEDNE